MGAQCHRQGSPGARSAIEIRSSGCLRDASGEPDRGRRGRPVAAAAPFCRRPRTAAARRGDASCRLGGTRSRGGFPSSRVRRANGAPGSRLCARAPRGSDAGCRPLRRGGQTTIGTPCRCRLRRPGPALRREDQLRIGASAQSFAEGVGDRTPSEQTARWESGCAQLRILPGPQAHLWPGDPRTDLENTLWTVVPDSDRVGVRLRPSDPTFAARLAMSRGIAPEGTVFGAIQITPDGGAIVLGPDRPVTGGYPMPAIVVRADLGVLARLRPGERLRMRRSTRVDAARARSLSPLATSRS